MAGSGFVKSVSNLRANINGRMIVMVGLTLGIFVIAGGFIFFRSDSSNMATVPVPVNDGSVNLPGLPMLDPVDASLISPVRQEPSVALEEELAALVIEREEQVELVETSPDDTAYVDSLAEMVPVDIVDVDIKPPPVETGLDDVRERRTEGDEMPSVLSEDAFSDTPSDDTENKLVVTQVASDEMTTPDSTMLSNEPNQRYNPNRIRPSSDFLQGQINQLAGVREAYQQRLNESINKSAEQGTFSVKSFVSESSEGSASSVTAIRSADIAPRDILFEGSPGDILYGYLDADINSDYLHEVIVTVGDGSVLDGAILVGKPELLGEKRIILAFDGIYVDNRPYPFNGVAVNPYTLDVAMADSVNTHFVDRYGSFMLASLMKGYADAYRTETLIHSPAGGSPVTVRPGLERDRDRLIAAGGEVADQFIPVLQGRVNRPPTVKVFQETGVGIKLLEPVVIPRAGSRRR